MSLCLTASLTTIAVAQLTRGLPPPAALSVSLPSVSGISVKDAVTERLVATYGGDEAGLKKALVDIHETSCLWLS